MKRSTFTGLAAGALGVPAFLRYAWADELVTVGTVNASSDVPFFIGDKKGFFRQEGLAIKWTAFDSAAKMVAPLGVNQLDVAAGAPSAGLYNAVAQGVDLKIVADKGSTPHGFGYLPLLVRSDLAAHFTYKDLKGMKVAEPAQGTSTSSTLSILLGQVHLSYNDVTHEFLGFPNHVAAFANKGIDASLTTEPSATVAVRSGGAVRYAGDDVWYPNQQLAVLLFGGNLLRKNREIGRKFMAAYIKSVRFYNDGLARDPRTGHGSLTGKNGKEILDILTEYTAVKDRSIYEQATPNGNDPDGRVNVASLRRDLDFFKTQGLVTANVTAEGVHDGSFVDAALKSIGKYKRA
ncbi:MAG TPA: ABC transporter substrate-binding protein [Candidatus Elarobacter sp.]|jgi:NitT/TauT family transport system substrate-binding protein|nr:ABC transporter substrate-binding protein [Candidatus Elarobacter sp.]